MAGQTVFDVIYLTSVIRLVTHAPSPAMHHKQDRCVLRMRWQIDIKPLRRIGAIGDVLLERDSGRQLRQGGEAEQQEEYER